MWSRSELKERAKSVLTNIYWSAFGVSIVIALAGANDGWSGTGSRHSRDSRDSFFSRFYTNGIVNWRLVAIALATVAVLISIRIFIGYALEVGGRKFYIQSAQFKDNKKCFSFSFKDQNYMSIVKTMLLTKVLIFLWTLLLIVPGIIKSYAYSMVPYILADNPNMGVKEAIKLSNEMTMGHKFDMFVLDLSFLGWVLLGVLVFGVGLLFVMPYIDATSAELYLVLRKEALKNNLCSYSDLMLNQPVVENNPNIW